MCVALALSRGSNAGGFAVFSEDCEKRMTPFFGAGSAQ
jgi:hypothetical protein